MSMGPDSGLIGPVRDVSALPNVRGLNLSGTGLCLRAPACLMRTVPRMPT